MQRAFAVPHSLYPFNSHWYKHNGIDVHYLDEGDKQAPVVLLLHGNFMWTFSYRLLIQQLKPYFRCIAIDLPGMGLSAKPHRLGIPYGYSLAEHSSVVTQLVQHLALRDITLLAHDHGGVISLNSACDDASRYKNIVLCNTWGWRHGDYLGTKLWSYLGGHSPRLIRRVLTNFQAPGWRFESRQQKTIAGVTDAYSAPYQSLADYKPLVQLAAQLISAKTYLGQLEKKLNQLSAPEMHIVWATAGNQLFAEFSSPELFLARWQALYPQANTTLLPKHHPYMVSQAPQLLVDTLKNMTAKQAA